MRNVLLFSAAFSLTLLLEIVYASSTADPLDIDHKAFRLMKCDSLQNPKDTQIRAAAECVFRGYYPLGPTTNL